MKRRYLAGILALNMVFSSQVSLFAAASTQVPAAPVFEPIRQSKAYHLFNTRSVSDHSKILYLVDRFADTQMEILYDGHYYNAQFTANVARWFVARRYRKETAEQWILKWCNATVPGGNLIWVKFPNGSFKLSREILLSELKNLNQTILEDSLSKKKNNQKQSEAAAVLSSAAVTKIVNAPANTSPSNPSSQAQSLSSKSTDSAALGRG